METIFFDLGGVLINFSFPKMCQNIAQFCNLDLEVIQAHLFKKNLGEKYEKGEINSHDIHKYFEELAGHPLNFSGLMQAAADIFSLKKEMPPILERLKKQGIRLFLLSNTCEAHFHYVKKHFEFLTLFDDFILSYEIGARKPEKKIYDTALKLAKTPKENCFYVDDVPEYVEAGLKLGIDSHLFQGADDLIQTLEKHGYIPK